MFKPYLAAAAAALLSLTIAPARAATIVAPNDRAGSAGDNPQYFVFGNGSLTTSTFQTAFAASQFAALPIGSTITAIGFRVRPNGFASDISYTDFSISIGTVALGYQNLAAAYLANEGADTVLARSGALTLSSAAIVADQPVNPFFTIAFTTPYTYRGGDLLVTTSFVALSRPQLGTDAVTVGGVTNTDGGGASPLVGGTNSYNAPIIAFVYAAPAAVPEAPTWALMVGGFGLAGSVLRGTRESRRIAIA